ncbi:uncharacterized protein EI90DRAFT_3145067 [Cantharellus anzutake]|uniref:uncharacterized protein n=1 Tax=Cantharellus anzutake TaxID=1750568 RepID=UPI001905C726|nr:uncharacterized protein EI90DRAFT_3145067 [Cantharellus anzutake]KAF8334136.1 hypothetical protein EI90DRAFT_3145067 [Cantharellus anzutake]
MKVVVIGAGPSGLVVTKTLLQEASEDFPFDPIILEAEDDIGGTFRHRSYENATLVSSKQLTSFSDFRLPLEHPDHLTLLEYVEYLRAYIRRFGFEDRIHLQCKVTKIRPAPGSDTGHDVEYIDQRGAVPQLKTIRADYIAVCSGLHVTPYIPYIEGIENVLDSEEASRDGVVREVYHSVEYKGRAQLAGRRVMILGTGETGHDLAYEAVKAGATEVILCTRGIICRSNDFEVFGFKFDGKIPIDVFDIGLITNLFETAYVHPWVAKLHWRWFISDFVIKRLLWIISGTMAGCNQWVGELDDDRLGRAYVFLNKSSKAMPYINRPYRNRPKFLDYLSRYIDPPEDSPPQTGFSVELAPFPSSFTQSGMAVFPLNHRKESKRIQQMDISPQTVIFATGYTQKFDFFDETGDYGTAGDADVRNVFKRGDDSLGFIGFVRPGVGAIPPISEMQSMFWISVITRRIPAPTSKPDYLLLVKETARIKYGVDHSTYMSTLAKDIGAAPGLWDLWKEYGTRVLVCYCFGAAFTTFYRLTGPYRSRVAPEIVKTELWETITRRGALGNFFMGIIPMLGYGILNLTVLLVEYAWVLLGKPALVERIALRLAGM